MECHKCQYNGQADEHCLTCKDTLRSANNNNHGVCFVSMQAIQPDRTVNDMISADYVGKFQPEPWELAALNEEEDNTENGFLDVPMVVEQACRKLLAVFSNLNDEEIRTVLCLNEEMTLDAIGRLRGVSRQAVHERIKRIIKKHKEFTFLLPSAARLNKKTCTNAKTGKRELNKRGTNE